jgi:bifunctional non-homologous end joining protein LigD
MLEAAALRSFPLLTGGKGIHLVVPLASRLGWEAVKGFARGMARALADSEPDRFVARAAKSARSGRIFIDWMRNERGATAICPYSPRAREGAPVAMPVSWEELSRIKSADSYNMQTALSRLGRLRRDPWDGYFGLKQSIAAGSLQLFGAEDR